MKRFLPLMVVALGAIWSLGPGEAAPPKKPAPKKEAEVKLSEDETALLKLINQERAKKKKPPFKPTAILMKLARDHTANMAKQGKLDHTLDGKTPFDRARQVGYRGLIGENVAGGG